MALEKLSECQLIMRSIKGSLRWLFVGLFIFSILGLGQTHSASCNIVEYKYMVWMFDGSQTPTPFSIIQHP